MRGTLPTSSAQFTSRKPSFEIGRGHDAFEEREGAIVQFHDHALERAERRRDFDEREVDRLFRTEHRAGSDAKEERVTDLTGSAGDRDFDG